MKTLNQKLTKAKIAIAKNPNSKATALRWYLKDHVGLIHNQSTNELRTELAKAIKEVKGKNAPAIVQICRDCVGDGKDGNCRNDIRNCEIKDCMLFNVRPYQSKPKVSIKKVVPRAFLGSNVSEVAERVTSTNSPSIKPLLEHIMTNCSIVEM
jgi:hypothetical protein